MSWIEVPSTTAPIPEPPSKQPCQHKWIYQGSDYEKRKPNYIVTEYKRIDTYYCEKCLEVKEIIAKQEDVVRSGSFVEKPYWYKG